MKRITPLAVVSMLCFALPLKSFGQVHEKFEGWCSTLEARSSSELTKFLNSVVPDEENARCVTWAIHRLGKEQYEAAIPSLVRLLDFRRPQKDGESTVGGFSREIFPAPVALELIGKKALPDLLTAIKANSTSALARNNAIAVWMEIYRYSDEHPTGVALLRQEETITKDDVTKQRLSWAVQEALKRCNPAEEAACKAAAAGLASTK